MSTSSKQREFRFRLWNPFYEEMFYASDLTAEEPIWLTLDGLVKGRFKHTGECDCSREYAIEQWTGLKDKNGKEVYEGDIIKSECYNDVAGFVEYNAVAGLYQIHGRGEGSGGLLCCFNIGISPYVVVGNIYENPELVESPIP